MNNVDKKIVLITGGTSGFGKETATLMTEKGATVIIASRNEEMLKNIREEIKCEDYIKLDVTNPDDWIRCFDYIKEKYNKIDFLLNIAGGGVQIADTVEQSFADIDKSIMLNLNSVIYGCKVFGDMMKQQHSGTIINVSSVCSKVAWPEWTVYAAAKWGVVGFSKGLYKELQQYNIRVSCISPGASSTGFQSNADIGEVNVKLTSKDVARAIYDICNLPQHVVVEEAVIWGIDQIVIPQ